MSSTDTGVTVKDDVVPVASAGVPPKRVKVTKGNTIRYGGVDYAEGDDFVMGDGTTADQIALQGQVEVVDHYAVADWNGKEGDKIRRTALAAIDAQHKREGSKRTHDHGFTPF